MPRKFLIFALALAAIGALAARVLLEEGAAYRSATIPVTPAAEAPMTAQAPPDSPGAVAPVPRAWRATTKSPVAAATVPRDFDARIPALVEAVAGGDGQAAHELSQITYWCGPWLPVPRDAAALRRAERRLVQTRQDAWGHIVDDVDAALGQLQRHYGLCRYLERRGIAPFGHWNARAAELGNHEAMVGYWHAQRLARGPGAQHDPGLRADAVQWMERARDEGYVEAFFAIGASKGGLLPDWPFEGDPVGALAHFYAEAELRAALAARSVSLTPLEQARLAKAHERAHEYGERLHAYQRDEARARAQRLIEACCSE